MKLLVIGFGSIGARHSRLACDAGLEVACVSRNESCPYIRFDSVTSALSSWNPNLVIISNPTADHLAVLKELDNCGFTGPILIEKPLFDVPNEYIPRYPERVFVAYNLRFHPLVQMLYQRLEGLPIFSAEFHAGQYLPDWRPGTDYRTCYSAEKCRGGGVLRDLSHEIDLAIWLCGRFRRIMALGGHFSDLEIGSDDVFMSLAQTERCPAVSVTMNYLNRRPQRTIRINALGLSAFVDLIAGRMEMNGVEYSQQIERDCMYRNQLMYFIDGNFETLCSYAEGVALMRFIKMAEESISSFSWQVL